jgi:hypothetical protein
VITVPPIGLNKLKGRWPIFRSLENLEVSPGSSSFNVFKPSGVVSGDVLVCFVNARNSSSLGVFGGTSWTQLVDVVQSMDGVNHQMACFYKVAGGAEPADYSIQFDTTGGNKGAVILAYSGAHGTPLDVSANALLATNATSHPMPSITPGFVNSLNVSCWFFDVIGAGSFGGVATNPPMDFRFGTSDGGFGGESEDSHKVYEERLGQAGVATGPRGLTTNNACDSYGITIAIRRA